MNQPHPPPYEPSLPRLRFDRNELAGSFGDIGTDLPLIVAMIPAAGLDGASVFIVFGLLQILTGVLYGLPMPMQPLKAMAVLAILREAGLSGSSLCGLGALSFFTFTGLCFLGTRAVRRRG